MRCFCRKSYLFSVFLLLFFTLFFSSLNISDSFALEDLTFSTTFNGSSFPEIGNFCNNVNNNPRPCTGYHYLLIEFDGVYSGSSPFPSLSANGYGILSVFPSSSFLLVDVSSYSRFGFFGLSSVSSSDYSSGFTVTYTLSDSNPFGSLPSGSLSISDNGTYDVSSYSHVVVDVSSDCSECSASGGQNYHDDLSRIYSAIIICAAVCLVLYFFFCIYRMIIKSSGGWS